MIKQLESPTWVWNGKFIPINQLDYAQLYHIKNNVLNKSNKPWFGKSKHFWNKSINQSIKNLEENNIIQITANIDKKRLMKVNSKVDNIIKMFNIKNI